MATRRQRENNELSHLKDKVWSYTRKSCPLLPNSSVLVSYNFVSFSRERIVDKTNHFEILGEEWIFSDNLNILPHAFIDAFTLVVSFIQVLVVEMF